MGAAPLLPPVLIVLFAGYLLYLAFVKKNIKAKLKTVVLPGLFFVAVWAILAITFIL